MNIVVFDHTLTYFSLFILHKAMYSLKSGTQKKEHYHNHDLINQFLLLRTKIFGCLHKQPHDVSMPIKLGIPKLQRFLPNEFCGIFSLFWKNVFCEKKLGERCSFNVKCVFARKRWNFCEIKEWEKSTILIIIIIFLSNNYFELLFKRCNYLFISSQFIVMWLITSRYQPL